jgi:hypothetical protein
MEIAQGEGLEPSGVPAKEWTGRTRAGRIRLQTIRPGHRQPLTDVLIGHGMMSLGGGGYGGKAVPRPVSGAAVRAMCPDRPERPIT